MKTFLKANILYIFISMILATSIAVEIKFDDTKKMTQALNYNDKDLCQEISMIWIKSNCIEFNQQKEERFCLKVNPNNAHEYRQCLQRKKMIKIPLEGALLSKTLFMTLILFLISLIFLFLKIAKITIPELFRMHESKTESVFDIISNLADYDSKNPTYQFLQRYLVFLTLVGSLAILIFFAVK